MSPLSSIEAFRSSREEMTSHDFGRRVGDTMWDDEPPVPFLVYASNYWIECLPDGRHVVTIENNGAITGEGKTLEDLEEMLYDYARNQEAEPSP
ncbi:hypothetical protein LAZ40_06725 [Cereibacter sphaeroides]|uniref:hypothetical protein n=1 Tax=Cereibacter sphaeroides TaxID=1063 RepID=UPI001F24731D|nr:hypothetical protein [Cereibacter sphaeroides]MCE6958740.1 hypothetical protein [Cereibacter sphaeroides]MCE6973386.1 hypothetical protein [Cereibacter sphaeroides]